jgi:L-threonylcarbamoyladenylate synthase
MNTVVLSTDTAERRKQSLEHAARSLREGRLVAFPTETVYGLGASACDERAVVEIFHVKGRPRDNPLIVHVESRAQAMDLMQDVPPQFDELANEFWPGPLTLVVRRNAAIADAVTAGLATVALRMPDPVLTRELLRMTALPVAAPSANISGRPSPTTARQVVDDLNGLICCVLDGGPCDIGIESTVLDLTAPLPVILRPGTVTREDIEDVIQSRVLYADDVAGRPLAPGMKYKHYAPVAELVLVSTDCANMEATLSDAIRRASAGGRRTALMAPAAYSDAGAGLFFSLGEGAPSDYARLLYAALRSLDEQGADVIFCPALPAEGIGHAVMNRLEKAATRILH